MKLLICLLFFQQLVFSQAKDPQYVAVEGAAIVVVPVEYFVVRITISSEGKSLSEANTLTKSNVLQMFDILKKYSINDSDFVTKSSETMDATMPSYRYDTEKKKPTVQYSGELILREPQIYDALFKDLMAISRIEVGVYDFGNSNIQDYKDLAYKNAVLNAKSNAELLLSGTGSKLGKIYKLLQDGRDRYHEYDDIEKVIVPKGGQPMYMSVSASPNTFRKKYFEEKVSVTIIYAIE